MHHLWESVIRTALYATKPKRVAEIGSEAGHLTRPLLDYCAMVGGELVVIDPAPVFDEHELKRIYGSHFFLIRGTSLSVLPYIGPFDAVMLDGDHNWYTVYHELKWIEWAATHYNRPVTVYIHDIDWPYGRRDLYYFPESIPAEYRHPYAKKGMVRGVSTLVDHGGLNDGMNNALYEGGPRNGVLTAVEDFMRETKLPHRFQPIYIQHGIGILSLNV
ncbi:class I SAM-dependent methyltransferase [Paenibacillus flagellatus]|uniref:Class I SAM-dependent methyltransferase n=1 Tax=Paenibacillus flagellatus TaxID=2211139 RepID=A0A2V5JZ69_9BACL|nr:class I SAM-dependent methyltransferase [Paenibacillus flagellatus]PYI52128.1 class I SAM-dependent methyltransferase [Paenibacillus flagellatus]